MPIAAPLGIGREFANLPPKAEPSARVDLPDSYMSRSVCRLKRGPVPPDIVVVDDVDDTDVEPVERVARVAGTVPDQDWKELSRALLSGYKPVTREALP